MNTILTQEAIDIVKSKSNKEQAEFLFDIINEGKETLIANKAIIQSNFPKMFHLINLHFCDFYLNDDIYLEFIEFITLNNTAIGTEKYNQIHSKIVDLISRYENNLGFVKKFIQLYNHESIDNGKLRTILITLKSFKDDTNIKATMEDIANLLRKKSNKTSI